MNRSDILKFQYLHSTTIDMHTNCTHVKITYQTTSELKMIIKNLKKTCPPAFRPKQKAKNTQKVMIMRECLLKDTTVLRALVYIRASCFINI